MQHCAPPSLAACVGILLLACSPQQGGWQLGLPGSKTGFAVLSVVPRGGYLDAVLKGPNFNLRTFLPGTEECRMVMVPEAEVQYVEGHPGGSFQRGDIICDSAGIGSLAEWRDRRARPPGPPQPRAQASFRRTISDNDVIFVRGRFPLTELVGWTSIGDTIAVLPNAPPCRKRADEGVASLEFRESGPDPLLLVGDEPCPLIGLIRPLPPTSDAR